jgi:DNA-binding transcriptional regulator YiaG
MMVGINPRPDIATGLANELKDLMDACDISSAELARRMDVYPNTVTGWTSGRHPVPGSVLAYMRLLNKIMECIPNNDLLL